MRGKPAKVLLPRLQPKHLPPKGQNVMDNSLLLNSEESL
jgi:hypothetical protein